ncbi:AAA family ATPase [Litoribacterium kuwaitense]|uniref:AAA family ATPase n=1 Tax=Litoribacterium kuwaitense TaxID=1398745 RepID=UPI001FE73645|nr:MoxR family ATPase [Litoribacterium kuwaitense]
MNQDHNTYNAQMKTVLDNIERVMIGKRETAVLSLVALLAKGHVLIEDVPGVGKTMMVRALAKSISSVFKRVQFTPDLLPSDLTGVYIYNQKTQDFEFRAGPLMGNVVLADEINRTSPKTQAALLESMEEGNITVDGDTKSLPLPFFVMATQNPVDYEGTYPLPEAQLDRFLLKMNMGYPSFQDEVEVLRRAQLRHPIEEVEPVLSTEQLLQLQEDVLGVFVDETVKRYIVSIVTESRLHPQVELGASPRGSISLMKAAQALAFIFGREYVIPDDVQYLAPYILGHRIVLTAEARFAGANAELVIGDILSKVEVPVVRELNL